MSSKSLYWQDKVLNWLRGTNISAAPGTLYIGLDTTVDTATGGTELALSGYARQAITLGAPAGSPVRSCQNTNAISFGPAGVDWGTIRSARLWDAVSAGNWIHFANINVSQVVNTGGSLDLAIGDVTVQDK